jgi:hypothetical protein
VPFSKFAALQNDDNGHDASSISEGSALAGESIDMCNTSAYSAEHPDKNRAGPNAAVTAMTSHISPPQGGIAETCSVYSSADRSRSALSVGGGVISSASVYDSSSQHDMNDNDHNGNIRYPIVVATPASGSGSGDHGDPQHAEVVSASSSSIQSYVPVRPQESVHANQQYQQQRHTLPSPRFLQRVQLSENEEYTVADSQGLSSTRISAMAALHKESDDESEVDNANQTAKSVTSQPTRPTGLSSLLPRSFNNGIPLTVAIPEPTMHMHEIDPCNEMSIQSMELSASINVSDKMQMFQRMGMHASSTDDVYPPQARERSSKVHDSPNTTNQV